MHKKLKSFYILIISVLSVLLSVPAQAEEKNLSVQDTGIAVMAVDQTGYRPEDNKVFFVSGDNLSDRFYVIQEDTGETVLEGTFDGPVYDSATKRDVYTGNFSSVTKTGTYHIELKNETEIINTVPFTINEDVYDDVFVSAVKMLTMQRCGTFLTQETGGEWAHEACHTGEAVIYGTDETKDVSGGWHDAGDYGRYVVPGAKAVADLFMAADFIEKNEGYKKTLLNEAKYELEWMLKIQSDNGGVYHKVSCADFPGTVMPEDETDALIISPVSDSATADFTAVAAKAYRVYLSDDPEFADRLLDAAKKAFDRLRSLEYFTEFKNPDGISTGEYSDKDMSDEYLWAVTELYLSGDISLEGLIRQLLGEVLAKPDNTPALGWSRVTSYALTDLLTAGMTSENVNDKPVKSIPPDILLLCRGCLFGKAEAITGICESEVCKTGLGNGFTWGSNMNVANNASLLMLASHLSGDDTYKQTALQMLHYLLGCNGLGQSFVTGFGVKSPQFPHHRPSQAVGKAVPGMLVGGPNADLNDSYSKENLSGLPPALCYADNEASYSSNEVAIYWNSALILLLSFTV